MIRLPQTTTRVGSNAYDCNANAYDLPAALIKLRTKLSDQSLKSSSFIF